MWYTNELNSRPKVIEIQKNNYFVKLAKNRLFSEMRWEDPQNGFTDRTGFQKETLSGKTEYFDTK